MFDNLTSRIQMDMKVNQTVHETAHSIYEIAESLSFSDLKLYEKACNAEFEVFRT